MRISVCSTYNRSPLPMPTLNCHCPLIVSRRNGMEDVLNLESTFWRQVHRPLFSFGSDHVSPGSLWFRTVNTPPPCLVAHVSSNVLCGDDPAALGVNQAPSTLARPPNRHSCTLPTKINPSSPMPSAVAHAVFPPTQPTARVPPSATRRLQQSLPHSQKRGSKQEMWKMLQFHHDVEYRNTPGVFTLYPP